jgi:type II restriction/modification system DNA methylase subunit YeeA
MCKLVTGLLNNKCKLFSGRDIFELRSSDEKANISKLTDIIDKLIYKLYNLTAEEIKIVESV